MEEKATIIESLFERIEVYAESSIDLLKLKTIDKSANMLSSAVSALIILIATLFTLMLVNIGVAFWIGRLINNSYGGFFIVAAFYAIVALLCYYLRKPLIKIPVNNHIIQHMRHEKTV
jgi:membrane protein implicated in regulation of membrane protease activity